MEPRLRRGIFGYSRKSVDAVVNEREISIIKASREAKEAKEQAEALAGEVGRCRIEIADLETKNRDLESKLVDAQERFRAVERSDSPSTTEGMTDVLHAVERALARLTDGARQNAERELGEIERDRDALRDEIDQLAAWRGRMAPLAESIPDSIQDVRNEMAIVAERLHEALAPVKAALEGLDGRLGGFGDVSDPRNTIRMDHGEVVSLGEATEEPSPEMTDAALGMFAPPPDRQAPSGTG